MKSQRMPVTFKALNQRVRTRLIREGARLYKVRGEGNVWYVVQGDEVVESAVDLIDYARAREILCPWEYVVGEEQP